MTSFGNPLLDQIVVQYDLSCVTEYVVVAPVTGFAVKWADEHLARREGVYVATTLTALVRVRPPREVIILDWPARGLRELSLVLDELRHYRVTIHFWNTFAA